MKYLVKHDGKVFDEDRGNEIKDKLILAKVKETKKQLRIPPSYTNVVISNNPNAKVLACGIDSKKRKQCIYNANFIQQQRALRFSKIKKYEHVLNRIVQHVRTTLKKREYTSDKYLICMILHIMLLCHFRIGNQKYVKMYKSYGVSTLEWRHVIIHDDAVTFRFIGKKEVENKSICKDKYVLSFIRRNKGRNTDRIFGSITSDDVNQWLYDFHPEANLTCKDLRTWQANKLFSQFIRQGQTTSEALKNVATNLHHTPSVCKKNYIDPSIIPPSK